MTLGYARSVPGFGQSAESKLSAAAVLQELVRLELGSILRLGDGACLQAKACQCRLLRGEVSSALWQGFCLQHLKDLALARVTCGDGAQGKLLQVGLLPTD